MIKFMFKCLVLCSVLLFGVLIGMQQANQGIIKMKGYHDPDLKSAFQVDGEHGGDLQASILGNEVTSQDLQAKQAQLEQIEAFNIFTQIGKQFASLISGVVTVILDTISNAINTIVD
ncbi:YqxA family protein [Metabacillus malikii]|uniref:DUF3679 domain-containing protein n=1 Tax=Metabacillus malikii TaxID=1504265 RepID=A0ABT9ZH19_9BACI|nr:YqxA family protein [Metabacillus malikii]MDQ0231578.1 hypothetical protein [Metabacillus malikii]